MNRETNRLLFCLLRSAICGNELRSNEKELLTAESVAEIMCLARKHDVEHLAAFALKQNRIPSVSADYSAKLENCILKAAFRHRQLNFEYENLCSVFEDAEIPFIPLKGSVIRKFYPEAWMRTSCDIDILICESDLDKATAILVDEFEYTYKGKGSHDVSLFSPGNIHLELHYNLVEDGIAKESSDILRKVWEQTYVRKGCKYCRDMTDAMFYFYHVAHMAKHFENGGCGIRPFIDMFILDNLDGSNYTERDNLLLHGGLLKFANICRTLARVWFGGYDSDSLSRQMEDYILRGGVYGNSENRITVQQQKKGGKLRYAISRIFIPYEEIKFHYPILERHKWLTPLMEVRRWFKLIFCGGAKRSINELKYNNSISADKASEMKKFLSNIGL